MAKTVVGYGDFDLKPKFRCKKDSRPLLEMSLVGAGMTDVDGSEWSSMLSLHTKVADQRWPNERRFEEEERGLFATIGWK